MKRTKYILIFTIYFSSCAVKLTNNKKVELTKELEEMVKTDQVAAFHWEEKWANYKDSVFTTHKIKVEKMFNKYGFLGFDKVGKDGSHNFWLIVQHCDKFPEFQEKVLKAMNNEVKKKNAIPDNYAFLYDRVKVNADEKQLFGTQVIYETATGRAIPKIGIVDSLNVDNSRKDYGLEPLKDYLNMLTTQHYEMNKEHYQKMGIMKPNLYE